MKKIKCMVVGLGRIGLLYDSYRFPKQIWTHSKAISKNKNFELYLGIDPNPKNLQIFKKRFPNARAYKRIEDVPKSILVDICIVSTPGDNHLLSIKKLIKKFNPKLVFCEKPIEYSLKKAKKLINLCTKSNIKLRVNYIRRCDPSAQKIKKFIKKNQRLNKNLFIHGTVRYSKGLLENGSHFIDLVTYWFGNLIRIEKFKKNKNFDHDFNLFFKNAKITFLSCNIKNFQNFSIELFFSKYRLRYDYSGDDIYLNKIIKHKNKVTRNLILNKKKRSIKSQFLIYQKNVMDELLKVYKNNKSEKLCTGTEALNVLKIVKRVQG